MKLKNTEKLLKQKEADNDFSSYAIYVKKDGEECFLHSSNVDEDTYFDIASMGKIFVTSPLILKAIGENKLSLNSKLDEFFSDVPSEKKNITVFQLLTHSSGIVRCPLLPENVELGSDAVAKQIIDNPLAYKSGEGQAYSCNGLILLGYILEKIYKMPLEKIFEEQLKNPLGYTRSKFNIEIDESNSACCYRSKDLEGLAHPWDDENIRILKTSAGSGGQFFTLGDIKIYSEAVMNKSEKLYAKEIYDLAEMDYTPDFAEGRGLGWLYVDERYPQTGKLFDKGSFGHCGHTGCSIFFSRKKNMYAIILTNATRHLNMKNEFKGYDYNLICKMREEIHNEIYHDLNI